MPGQFGGNKATPVGAGRRVLGHLLWMAGLLISSLLAVSGTFLGSEEITAALSLGGMVLGGVVLVFSIAAALLWSTSFGGKLLGYRFVDSRTNQPKGSVMLARFLVQVIFECVTLMLGTISYYFTYRDGQHWLDRVFNLVAVDKGKAPQVDPVHQEPTARAVAAGGAAMPQPAEAYATSPFSAPAPRMSPGSAFAPPAYGGPAARPAACGQQVRMPQPVAVGAGTGGAETPRFEMQQPPGFSAPEGHDPGGQPAGAPFYPPTAAPVPPEPVMSSPDRVPATSVPSPAPETDAGGPIPAPARGMSPEMPPAGPAPGTRAVPTRAAEPVRPPSPFTPQPFPSPSPFPPPSPTSPSQASVFQPPAGSWVANSASPVFPPVSPARATTSSPAEPPAAEPVPAIRAARTPSLVQDRTIADEKLELSPEVVLDDGLRIKVDGSLVLGRNPLAPDAYPDARSVRVTDESMRLSKTHMVLRPVDGHVQVIDVGATNGVYIEVDRERTRIPTHEPWQLSTGDLVHFGGRTLRLVP